MGQSTQKKLPSGTLIDKSRHHSLTNGERAERIGDELHYVSEFWEINPLLQTLSAGTNADQAMQIFGYQKPWLWSYSTGGSGQIAQYFSQFPIFN